MNSCEYVTMLKYLPRISLPAVLCDVSGFRTVSSKPHSWGHLLWPDSIVGQSEPQENSSTKDTFICCCSYCKNILLQYSAFTFAKYLWFLGPGWFYNLQGRTMWPCVALPPHRSRVHSSSMRSGYCLCGGSACSPHVHVQVVSSTSQKHAERWIGDSDLRLGVNECVNTCVINVW